MIIRLLVIIALLLGGTAQTSAQPAPPVSAADALAAHFAEDAASHVRDLDDLYSKRGLSAPKMKQATVADVARYLATQRDDDSPGYPQGTAVLFYSHRGDQLAIYLIGTGGIIAYHETDITPAELRIAASFYRQDLAVDGLDRSRAPLWTGTDASPAEPVVTASKANRNTPIDQILLPPDIRKALLGVRHLVIVANGVIATNPFAAFPLTGRELLIDRMSITVSAGLFDLDQMIRPWTGLDEYVDPLVVGDPLVPASPDWKVPLLPGVRALAAQGYVTGASGRNWAGYGHDVSLPGAFAPEDRALLTDPQTSGGLLVACEPGSVDAVLAIFRRHGFDAAAVVGRCEAAVQPRLVVAG